MEVMDSFSAHADRNEISDFLANQRKSVKKLFLVHGEIEKQESLAELLSSQGFAHIEIPKLGEEIALS